MKIFEVTSRMPDGTEILEFTNGYTFEGTTDARDYPVSGILKTPEGEKYDIPQFEEDPYKVFALIEKGELERYKINS